MAKKGQRGQRGTAFQVPTSVEEMVATVTAPFSASANLHIATVECYGGSGGGGAYPSKFMEIRWISGRSKNRKQNPILRKLNTTSESNSKPALMVPICVSTDPSAIELEELRQLYNLCNISCHRFPRIDPKSGRNEEAMDLEKLRIALSHSAVVVSIFCKAQHLGNEVGSKQMQEKGMVRDLIERVVPVSPANGLLVGFGRAVSDLGLTASIHDIMVIPSLQGRGIGKMIVKRIVRALTSRDIYDIATLCSKEERFFFEACGFGDDILGSTTMMYTRAVSDFQNDQLVTRAGRKLLLAPPVKEPFAS